MTATTLKRLLAETHAAVFDHDPIAALAFRLRHPDGAAWSLAEGVLSVAGGSNAARTYTLSAFTVGQLVTTLRADGFEVLADAASLAHLSALVLIEGSGDQNQSNGDHLYAFTSLLWALLTGYSGELRDAKAQIAAALRQMVIPQSEGEWLDVWGKLYGVPRKPGQTDAAAAARIPQEAFRLRVNAHGIEKAVYDETGYRIVINEPWKDVFRLDESLLSGHQKFYDGDTIGYHLIRPVATGNVDWSVVYPIIERNKAAGVMILPPEGQRMALIDASLVGIIHFGTTRDLPTFAPYEDRALLDFSAIEDVSIPNHESRRRREILRSTYTHVLSVQWGGTNWGPDQTWTDNYVVSTLHSRNFRVYYSALKYGNFWVPDRTWRTAASDWANFGPLVASAHSRS